MAFFAHQMHMAYAGLVGLIAYGIYRFVMPRPLPGIAYSKHSIRPFGDIPAMLKSQAETNEASAFILDRIHELQVPVFQMFVDPIGKPWVVVADSLITEDILAHRSNEFDLSPIFSSIFRAVIPNSMMMLKTSDPQWKIHRRLLADTMSNKFLQEASGPHILDASKEFVTLWTEKARLSEGGSFDAFGKSLDLITTQIEYLSKFEKLPSRSEKDNLVVNFPRAAQPEAATAVYTVSHSSEIALKHPLRDIAHSFAMKINPTLRKAKAYRDQYIADSIQEAWQRFSTEKIPDFKSVSDLIVEREVLMAKREGRAPAIDSSMVKDELFTFVLGAHDTTATTIQWGVKYITQHQDVQRRLREELKAEFGDNQFPDATQIAQANLPYLEATIYEILRVGTTAIFLTREAQTDLEIVGNRVPKGCQVIMMLTGPGYLQPRLDITTDIKNPFTGNWDPKEVHLFKPSRWLVETDGELKFDPRAGPNHVFSTGTRSCFGKRMALFGLRLILTAILLNFELQPIAEGITDFRAIDVLIHHPERSLVRPVKI